MRITVLFLLVMAMAFTVFVPHVADAFGPGGASGQGSMEVRHRTFTKAEIESMSRMTALIRTSLGEIKIRFFPEVAPNHVRNFMDLAKSGFYDRTVFHRVIPGFMIQGGDPNSKNPRRATHGVGGPSYVLKAEFNDQPHKRGTLSMARKQSPDSAGSQFFICVADTPWLDRQYTVFGEVISGMEVVDKIVSQPRDTRDNPLERVEVTIRIIEPRPEKKPEAKPEERKPEETKVIPGQGAEAVKGAGGDGKTSAVKESKAVQEESVARETDDESGEPDSEGESAGEAPKE